MAAASDTKAPAPEGAPLQQAAAQTYQAAAEVKRASEDLLVVNSVLEQELPEEVQTGEVAQAIEHTIQLEKKLAESAESLAEVHATLQDEIRKRKAAEARIAGEKQPAPSSSNDPAHTRGPR